MKALILATLGAVAGCHSPSSAAPPTARPVVVTDAASKPAAPIRSLPPPLLPVDCTEAEREGTVTFCEQRIDTSATHVACHRPDQVSTAALACLPELRSLTLRWTKVARLEPLRKLKHLRRLNLSHTNVADLGPLAALSSLRELGLDETRVIDLTPLAALPELSKLRLRKAPHVEWTTLSGFPALIELDVSDNDKPDLAALAGHGRLQTLLVADSISNVAPLADMPQLRKLVVLHARSNAVTAARRRQVFEGLAAVTQLRELELYESKVTSLAPLAGMSKLEQLWVDAPEVTSLAPLANLKRLTFLGLADLRGLGDRSQAELASLGVLPRLVNLTVFKSPNDTSYLEAFKGLEGLMLSASGPGPLDIGGVASLPKLEVLNIRSGTIARLSPLRGLKNLTRLEMDRYVEVPTTELDALHRARPGLVIRYDPKTNDGPDDW